MPDDAAALSRRFTVGHALQRFVDGAELLIAGHDLIRPALGVRREQRERLQQRQQIFVRTHASGEPGLIAGRARRHGLALLISLPAFINRRTDG